MGRMELNFWSTPAHAILTMLAAWIHREKEAVVAYQKEEIRALREMLGGERLRFTDAQRRRLALKARPLSPLPRQASGARLVRHPRHADRVVPQARGRQVR
jgi:hypothetical protein